MGFISSGDTTILSAYLTQRGRELLLNGTEDDIQAAFYALGDSDSNYKITNPLDQGYVPDLTGDNSDCVISLATNISIKYPLSYNITVPSVTQVMFQRTDNGQYYNTLDCLIHLDQIGRYQLYNSSANLSNVNRLKVNSDLISPFQDLFTSVAIVNNPSLTPAVTDFDAPDSMIFDMQFDPAIYRQLNNTYIDTTVNNTVTQTNGAKSPIVLTFSSVSGTTGNTLYGAGKSSVGLYNREIGYAYMPDTATTWSFLPASQTEMIQNYVFYTDGNNTLLNQYTHFTIAAKIDSKDDTTGNIRQFIYRGNNNLANISDANLIPLTNETRFANQYAKLFDDNTPILDGTVSPITLAGLMTREINNLRDFVQTSGIFTQISGTNEYRTSKLTFSVYPKNTSSVLPATLNIIFSYNDDVLLDADNDTSHISDQGNLNFIEYDFTPTNGIFLNKTKTGQFTKNNCSGSTQGTSIIYTVSGGTYTGSTQSAADTLAQNDINTNGQAYANANGTCVVVQQFSSAIFAQNVQKNDCGANYGGTFVYVQYPYGQFTSLISQADANAQAVLAAQLQANSQGTCVYAPPVSGGCLLAGQQIIIDDQLNTKSIEFFKVGDLVWTFNENISSLNNNQSKLSKVSSVYNVITKGWYKITIKYGQIIKCSPSHLFMVDFNQRRADKLKIDDNLMMMIDENNLEYVAIENIEFINESINVYNIEVEENHTYLTDNGIWHHNKLQAI